MTSEASIVQSDEEDEEVLLKILKRRLLKCLNEIPAVGNVATSKQHRHFTNPGLTIGDTLIPLPLAPRDAESIKSVCRQAPFGRGDETVVDTSVRKTWELDPSQFKLANPDWDEYLYNTLLKVAAQKLGLSDVRADLYKLLLYEPGSFFKRHKDSEKAPGMVATMVVCLPSKHAGGNVHLSHLDREQVFETGPTSDSKLTSLAWYSDVTHEVKPLTSGYRLALTYNLIHTGDVRISARLFKGHLNRLTTLLRQWNPKAVHRLVHLLEHKYSMSSLSLDNLKGRDRVVCECLREAGLQTGHVIFLANLDRTKDPEDYYSRNAEVAMELNSIKSCDGRIACPDATVGEHEIIKQKRWNRDPDSESEGEFTGNESMPGPLRYHDTVSFHLA